MRMKQTNVTIVIVLLNDKYKKVIEMFNFGKLRQDFEIALKEALRLSFEKCDFHNDCDFCEEPKLGTFAFGGHSAYDVDGYICGKCILKKRDKNYEYKTRYNWKGIKNEN